jgi:FKBP-type peptidyl-prolyl cis-trans isomerase SlyD
MKVADGNVIEITYELRNSDGEVLETIGDTNSFSYLHGFGNIIPGLEAALDGLDEGESFDVEVPPGQAYGEFSEELVGEMQVDVFPDEQPPEEGMVFEAKPAEGQGDDTMFLRVVSIDEDNGEVKVDGNHPLAGETLQYTGAIESVREATEQEQREGRPADRQE